MLVPLSFLMERASGVPRSWPREHGVSTEHTIVVKFKARPRATGVSMEPPHTYAIHVHDPRSSVK